jgi:hypothetical protein
MCHNWHIIIYDEGPQKTAGAVLFDGYRPKPRARVAPESVDGGPAYDRKRHSARGVRLADWAPHCAALGRGLWEVRSTLEGNRIARVLFCMAEDHMVLLHAFIKKTQKTPAADIDLALKRKHEVT